MAAYNKFNGFTQDLVNGVHNFGSNVFKVMLSNAAPAATNTIKANLFEITAGNGYTSGGNTSTATVSSTSGTAKVTVADTVFTAAGGTIGPFRYAILYNDTPTSPAKPLIAYWDYGSSITLNDTETLTVDFDNTNGVFTIA